MPVFPAFKFIALIIPRLPSDKTPKKGILRINNSEKLFLGIQKIENEYILNTKISNPFIFQIKRIAKNS